MANFTTQDLVEEIRKQAALRPNRVYKKVPGASHCQYDDSGDSPGEGCIVGVALKALGVQTDAVCSAAVLLIDLGVEKAPTHPTEQCRWISAVQYGQDGGLSWKEAVENADEQHSV